MRVGVQGTGDLYKLAAALRDAGERKLAARLDKGIHKSAKVIEDKVHKSTDRYIPKDFERQFKASLKSRRSVSLVRGRTVTIIFEGMGKRGATRKLANMERGILEHPIFGRGRRLKSGRWKKNKWVKAPNQRIRPGVISEPVREAQPEAVKVLNREVAELAAELNRIT